MKTLADIKRSMQVGTTWEAFNYMLGQSFGIREVSISQSNAIAFKIEGKNESSWWFFPKANHILFIDENTFIVLEEDYKTKKLIPCLRYTKTDSETNLSWIDNTIVGQRVLDKTIAENPNNFEKITAIQEKINLCQSKIQELGLDKELTAYQKYELLWTEKK